MHSKNNNKTQTFIQGLRPFSSSIPKTLKKHLRKGGYNYSNIVDNWTNMVSKKISDSCYPVTVKMGKEMRDGTLVLNVIHGKEMEVEYKKNEIVDKINSFFGYKAITDLRLQQNFIPEKKTKGNVGASNQTISEEEKISIKNEIDIIKNKDLEKSIVNLGASINREEI